MTKFFKKLNQGKLVLNLITLIFFIGIIWPIALLIGEGIIGVLEGSLNLGVDGFKQIRSTFILLILSTIFGASLGGANGWLLANCRFKGRKILKIAQLFPLATPAYLLSATLIDLGSINGFTIHGLNWAILIMAFTTYPYVFLLSTESFAKCGSQQLEACRSLGIGPWQGFFRVALPMTMPAIGAGVALMGMEIINELGAVQLLNVPSISAGIIENWVARGNPAGAIALALVSLIMVFLLLTYEKTLRRKSKRWTEGLSGENNPAWELEGLREFVAQVLSLIPPLFTLGVPILWIFANTDQILNGFDYDLLLLTKNSILLGLLASLFSILLSTTFSIAKRWNPSKWMKVINLFSGFGYAIPGVVLALALLSFNSGLIAIPAFILLIWGYVIRFLAVSKSGIDSSFERMNTNIDEAGSSLGLKWPGILKKIHLPLLKGPISVGVLLVFVDTLKELPLTFVLRPFNFDTLSVRIFQYAGDERMGESIIPTIILLFLGLIASLALVPNLDSKQKV